jgi:hypothetical protein
MVMYLCSDKCRESGAIFNSGMGYFNRAAVLTGPTVQLGDPDNPPTPEQIHANWEKINSMDGAKEMEDANTAIFALITPSGEDGGGNRPPARRGHRGLRPGGNGEFGSRNGE